MQNFRRKIIWHDLKNSRSRQIRKLSTQNAYFNKLLRA
jgi:hypothetical protein